LIVEDEPDTADSLALLFRFWGFQVAVAYDGPEALEAAPAFQPEVVFLDIQLATTDGCAVARQLRRLPGLSQALLVAISGHGYEADVRRCKEAGIDFHFLKPVQPAILREILSSARKVRREQGQLVCSAG